MGLIRRTAALALAAAMLTGALPARAEVPLAGEAAAGAPAATRSEDARLLLLFAQDARRNRELNPV